MQIKNKVNDVDILYKTDSDLLIEETNSNLQGDGISENQKDIKNI